MGYFAVKGFLFFLLCVIEQIHSGTVRDNDLIVKLASPVGKIRGHILQSGNGKNYYAFQQIPYAAAPVGNLRFKPPQPRETWDGILDTTAHTKRCPQAWVNDVQQTEDCLNLNVYTPVKPNSNKKLAVYVWIFGGGFQIGDGSNVTYNPKYFMDYDVVVVTLDYRLGILGFLTTDDGVIPGNLGLRDQHFALEWVQKNIHLFGGDPTRVTIGGESAGAASVAFQTIGDLNNGKLFRGAIQQSGSGLNRWAYQNRPTYYAFKAGQFLDSTLRSGDSNQLLKVLLKANFSQLIDIQEKITNEEKIVGLAEDQIWVPVVEKPGKGQTFLSSPMHDTFRFKQWHKVPTLIGMNSEEGAWFLPSEPVKNSWELSWEQVRDRASDTDKDYRNLISDKLNIPENEKARAGEELKKIYTNGTFLNDLRAFTRFSSDAFIMQPIMRQAVLEAHDNDVYFYQFSYNGRNSSFMPGAAHTDELPYFWEFDVELTSEFDLKLRHRLLKLWTNFIKYQNPTPAADNDLENILWPKLHCFSCCKFLDINVHLTIQRELRNYQKYARVLEKYVQEPWYVY